MTSHSSPHDRRRSYTDRITNTRELVQRFLIICEGEKTEPSYFKAFQVPGKVKIAVKGIGYNTVTLVQEAIKLKSKHYDQVWCVFDKDSFSPEQFNQAIFLAEQHAICVAYSNEAFELWFVLHFCLVVTGVTRKRYIDILTDRLNKKYDKCSNTMYYDLLSRQDDAIKNATRLLAECSGQSPSECNPSTTVHLLVQELNKYTKSTRYS